MHMRFADKPISRPSSRISGICPSLDDSSMTVLIAGRVAIIGGLARNHIALH